MNLKWDKTALGFLKNSILSVFASLVVGIGGYLIRRILANTLSVEDFADFYFLMAAATMLVVLFRFGTADMLLFSMAGMEKTAENPKAWNLFSGVCRFNLYVFSGVSIICLLFSLFSTQRIVFCFLIPFFLLFAFEEIFNNALNALKLFREQYGLKCLKTLLMLALVCFCSSQWGLPGTIIAFNIPMVVTGVGAVICLWRISSGFCFRKPEWNSLRSSWRSCLSLLFLSFNVMIFNELGTVMLTLFSMPSETAVFNIALPIAMIIRSFYCIVMVLVPFVGEMKCDNDYSKIRRYLHCGIVGVLLTVIFIIPLFRFWGRWMLILLFGEQFQNAVFSAFLLSETMLIAFIGQMNINILNTLNKEKESAILTLLIVFFSIAAYAISAKLGGADWTAAACLISAFLWSIISYIVLILNLEKHLSANPGS